jgi:hypothetical protein
MENKNNKVLYYVIGVVIIIVIIIFWSMKSATPVADNTALGPVSTLDTSGQVNPVSIAYADALIKYADRRIQFDPTCQAHPNIVTYKDNTGIMIDNRAPVSRTIKIGTTFTVKAWGFKIFVLPDVYLKSKTILVDCDKSQNVATILVQE